MVGAAFAFTVPVCNKLMLVFDTMFFSILLLIYNLQKTQKFLEYLDE